jgi:hypothetical protein
MKFHKWPEERPEDEFRNACPIVFYPSNRMYCLETDFYYDFDDKTFVSTDNFGPIEAVDGSRVLGWIYKDDILEGFDDFLFYGRNE